MRGDEELYSQRQGRARSLEDDDFANLVWRQLAELRREGYFDEALGPLYEPGLDHPGGRLTASDFLRRLRKADIYPAAVMLGTHYRPDAPSSCRVSPDVLFDLLEFLYREAVAGGGQTAFRAQVNPDLALYTPPMELLANGQIVAKAPGDLYPLLNDPIADDLPSPVRDPLRDAIAQFRQRGATDHDKRSALKHLADVLEPLRQEIDEYLLPADEADLFQIANRFWIRHNNRAQKRNYDGVWLDWTFYVYVATARSLLSVLDRQVISENLFGEPPDAAGGLPL